MGKVISIVFLSSLLLLLLVAPIKSLDGKQARSGFLNYAFASSPDLDVYTQKGGKGHGERSDAFGPGEVVFLYANVTNDMMPVQGKNVTFNVYDAHSDLWGSFSNISEADGIAAISYRFPWPYQNPTDYFGNWTAIADAETEGNEINDTVGFEYGWLSEVLSVESGLSICGDWLPNDLFYKLEPIDVKVEVKTILLVPTNVTIAVVIRDDLDVPILQTYLYHTMSGRNTESISFVMGDIPKWAFVGTGGVYVSVFEGWQWPPLNQLCPEATTQVQIRLDRRVRITVPHDYPTIQAAIAASCDWNEILVSPGVYHEHLLVDKPLWLLGENGTIIDGEGTGVGLNVSANFTVIKGFTVRNCSVGIQLSNSCRNIIYHNSFLDNEKAVCLQNMCDNTWDNGDEGNYWSDYNGTDSNSDGIGDTYLPWQGVDRYPLMSPSILGDVNHDGTVDIFDAVLLADAAGSEPGDARWNPHADLNEDKIIDLFDAVILASHAGEHP